MKKIILIILLVLGLTGCEHTKNEFAIGGKSEIQIQENEVSLSIKEGTLTNTSATLVLTNHSDKNFHYGNPYTIEIKQNGKWHTINVELNFTMPAYSLQANEVKEIELNWENSYGALAKGTYRIIKSIDYEYEEGKYEDFYVAAIFTIGKNQNEMISDFDFYTTKPEQNNTIRFHEYYTSDNRTVYLAGNVEEFYIKDEDNVISLKTYLSTTYQTIEDGIKRITDNLELKETLQDGGTKIYKSKEKDITLILCNTIAGNKNIFIGDYELEYTEGDCFDEEQIKNEIKTNLEKITGVTDFTSSNPFDYTKNEYYMNIIDIGEDAVQVLENMYKAGSVTGVNAYLSALAIEDITKCNLYEEYQLDWSTAEEFYDLWENYNCSFNK